MAISTHSQLFFGLTDEHAQAITVLASHRRLSAGDVLFRMGDQAERFYAIESGQVALTLPVRIRDRDHDLLVEECGPGHLLGWSALIPPHRLTLTATAQVETTVLAVPRLPLLLLCDARPDLGYALMKSVATVVGHRLPVMQAMWLREVQRFLGLRHG